MKWHVILPLSLVLAGCASLPFEAGHTKDERPYPEGEWVGPVSVEVAERVVFAASKGGKNQMDWVLYDVRSEWRKLKNMAQPGDEIWEFRMSPFVVDGGNRYFGYSLVRGNMIRSSVITGVIEEHAP
jgi:hypothetical protein